MIFFSIITICKNNLSELKETNNSILKQTSNNFEWIIVDGNSTDGTNEWLQNNRKVTYISEDDNGIYDAMNKGISLTSGHYLIFMNSGDLFDNEDVLEISTDRIKQSGFPAFVYGDSIDVAENGSTFYRKAKNYKKNWKGMITQHQAMFFNREKLNDLKYNEEFSLSGDYAFISSLLKNLSVGEILYLDYPICKFSMGGINESRRFDALNEDYKIRRDIIRLPFISNLVLYVLHYMHAVIKRSKPSLRFVKHKSLD